jgi:hypothetical protein
MERDGTYKNQKSTMPDEERLLDTSATNSTASASNMAGKSPRGMHVDHLELERSIYDDLLISPMAAHKDNAFLHILYVRVWFLFVVTTVLQFTVLYQIGGPRGLLDRTLSKTRLALFGKPGITQGMCYWQDFSEVPAFNQVGGHPPDPEAKYLNCIPDEVFFSLQFFTIGSEW